MDDEQVRELTSAIDRLTHAVLTSANAQLQGLATINENLNGLYSLLQGELDGLHNHLDQIGRDLHSVRGDADHLTQAVDFLSAVVQDMSL